MKHDGFDYEVKLILEFTREEVDLLFSLAGSHYDGHCRSFAQEGGLLTRYKFLFKNEYDSGTGLLRVSVRVREIDTLLKILEGAPEPAPALWFALKAAFVAGNEEYKRLVPEDTGA